MAAQGWTYTIMMALLGLVMVTFISILTLYVVVMAYFSSKILKGWQSNRSAAFEEMKQEREKLQSKSSVGAGADKEPKGEVKDEENNQEPYLIAGFFHPYWYDPSVLAFLLSVYRDTC